MDVDDIHNNGPQGISPNMTPEELKAYAEGTRARSARAKPRPSLGKYRASLIACVKNGAVMKQVFDDLIATDKDVLDEFGPNGHRAFNACVKRMAGK